MIVSTQVKTNFVVEHGVPISLHLFSVVFAVFGGSTAGEGIVRSGKYKSTLLFSTFQLVHEWLKSWISGNLLVEEHLVGVKSKQINRSKLQSCG